MTSKTDFTQAKLWLTKAFGKGILFESQESKERHKYDERENSCAWQTHYSGDLYLRMDLPPLLASHFAASLQNSLLWAIEKQLAAETPTQDKQTRNMLLRASEWPMPSEVIRDSLYIDTQKLKFVAAHLTRPADMTECTVREMLAHEAAWIERKQSVASLCNRLFLGLQKPPENRAHFGFYYGRTSKSSSGLEVAFKIGDYFSPFPEDTRDTYHAWYNRNHELGLEGLLSYDYWCSGGHEALEEHRFVLDGISDTDFANKLEILRQPEKLVVVRQYIHEVIAATKTDHWFQGDVHPDYNVDLEQIREAVPRHRSNNEQDTWFDKKISELNADPKYSLWRAVFPELAKKHPTLGELVQNTHGDAPKGQEEVYARLQRWTDETFPLLPHHLAGMGKVAPSQPIAG